MFLGPITAKLIANWILRKQINISHLMLGQNNLGDAGLECLAVAISTSKTLVAVDLSQNAFTPRCSHFIAEIISRNSSIVDLNLGSLTGSNRNRLGKDGGLAIAYGLTSVSTLVQYLHLSSITMGNAEIESIAASLQDYYFLLELDLSENRIEGARGGSAIARIIGRKIHKRGGEMLQKVNLSNNKLGNFGFAEVMQELLEPDSYL